MDGVEAKIMRNPPLKTHKFSTAAQFFLRFLAGVASSAAAWIMFTSNQTVTLFDMQIEAHYSYSSAFKFLAVANVIAGVFSVISLFVALAGIVAQNCLESNKYFFIFLHDLVVMTLVMAACAAATAIGFVARYGNIHLGWMAVCDNFDRLCDRIAVSIMLSYLCFVLYLILTVISARKSRKIQA